jgi:PAS domain S-box-containing protein
MQDRPPVTVSIDFRRVFDAVPHLLLVCDLDLRVVEANSASCAILGRRRESLVGREAFSLFPDNPQLPARDGAEAVRTSMEVARETGQTQVMPVRRYDGADPGTGIISERYWSIVTVPVLDDQGGTVLLLNQVDDVTASVLRRVGGRDGNAEAAVYARAHDLTLTHACPLPVLAALPGLTFDFPRSPHRHW